MPLGALPIEEFEDSVPSGGGLALPVGAVTRGNETPPEALPILPGQAGPSFLDTIKSAAKNNPELGLVLGLLIGGAADVFSGTRGVKGKAQETILALHQAGTKEKREQAAEERRVKTEERQVGAEQRRAKTEEERLAMDKRKEELELAKFSMSTTTSQVDLVKKLIDNTVSFRAKNPDADPGHQALFAHGQAALARQAGVPLTVEMFGKMVAGGDVASLAANYWPWLKNNPSTSRGLIALLDEPDVQKQREGVTRLAVGGGFFTEALAELRGAANAVRQIKKLKPDVTVPAEDALVALLGDKGPGISDYVRGVNVPKEFEEDRKNLLKAAGITPLDLARKVEEKTALQAAEGPVIGKEEKEFLTARGIKNPSALNPEDPKDRALIEMARDSVAATALTKAGATAELVAKAQARVKAGESLDAKERAGLANAYRTQARLQIEAQHKGEFGALLLTDEQRAQLEHRIETRTRELATADGLQDAIWPAKGQRATPAPQDMLSRRDPRYGQLRNRGLSDAQILQKYNVRVVD